MSKFKKYGQLPPGMMHGWEALGALSSYREDWPEGAPVRIFCRLWRGHTEPANWQDDDVPEWVPDLLFTTTPGFVASGQGRFIICNDVAIAFLLNGHDSLSVQPIPGVLRKLTSSDEVEQLSFQGRFPDFPT